MSDPYLWDKSGAPDAEVERLESLLAGYRYRGAPPRRRRLMVPLAAAAALVVAVCATWYASRPGDTAAWDVEWTSGGRDVAQLTLGEWLETGDGETARIAVADIGHVDVDPRSRVRLTNTGSKEHRLELQRGKLHAVVSAPPRLFIVDTPAATAVDLGCEYTLEVDDDGDGVLHVALGYVELEAPGRTSFVPAGAACRIASDAGPQLPFFEDASDAIRGLDPQDSATLVAALETARPEDTLTLWHALPHIASASRPAVVERIAELGEVPADLSRADLVDLNTEALDEWRDLLERLW